jgi:hypothetical protein
LPEVQKCVKQAQEIRSNEQMQSGGISNNQSHVDDDDDDDSEGRCKSPQRAVYGPLFWPKRCRGASFKSDEARRLTKLRSAEEGRSVAMSHTQFR